MIVLTLFGWGAREEKYEVHKGIQKDNIMVMGQSQTNKWSKAQEEKRAETTTEKTMKETDEIKGNDAYNDPVDGKSDKSTVEQQQASEKQQDSKKQQEELEQQQVGDDSSTPTGTTIRKAVILTKALNVRKKAKKDATVILILEREMELELLEEYEDGWAKIRYEGKEGYVYSEYIEPID